MLEEHEVLVGMVEEGSVWETENRTFLILLFCLLSSGRAWRWNRTTCRILVLSGSGLAGGEGRNGNGGGGNWMEKVK